MEKSDKIDKIIVEITREALLGQHVEIIKGALKGEKATITPNPDTGNHEDNGDVWLVFDRDGEDASGLAILDPSWTEIDILRIIR